ncbi:MAG: mercury methylation corrinoid protein HgcA [Candidatus Methanoperedens sp.]|nr:mercury methylation corrinoid protein HgcA [Candidatus Methanoperedens sp.]
MKQNLEDQTLTSIKQNEKTGACCSSPLYGSKTISILSSQSQKVIRSTSSDITFSDHLDHFIARLGVKREKHIVEPGLYAMGIPKKESPVFVSANYTLSFDALRSSLKGIDCYILVLDTKGINVWCAAGKKTFGTNELVYRIEIVGLDDIVNHRTLIVPQLGATGINSKEVRARCGFKVEFGPVRADDLPEYLKTHHATDEMRRVRFTLYDRIVLIPVELNNFLLPFLIVSVILALTGNYTAVAATIATAISGLVLFPILLPWIPTTDFSTKGFIIGGLTALPFVQYSIYGMMDETLWVRYVWGLAYLLVIPSISAFLALNFTGSSTFTSVTGVKSEIFTYMPKVAVISGIGILLIIVLTSMRILEGI